MASKIRIQRTGRVYLVTNRTLADLCLMRPSKVVNEIILRTFVWSVSKHAVSIYGFNFRPSDFWILVSAPQLNLHDFMRDFQSQLAIKLNQHWGRTGKFFAERYKCTHLLDNSACWRQLVRLLCAPSEVDLVEHPTQWPGVSSWGLHQDGGSIEVERENRTKYWRLKQKHPGISDEEATRRATERHRLELEELSYAAAIEDMSYAESVSSLVESEVRRIRRERTSPCLGIERIERLRPTEPAPYAEFQRREPAFRASFPGVADRFRRRRRHTELRYELARTSLRRGLPDVRFPEGTIPLHKTWVETARDKPPDTTGPNHGLDDTG